MAPGTRAWLRSAYICAALLVVPIAGFVVILLSLGDSSAESDEDPGQTATSHGSGRSSPLGAGPKAPPGVRKCCLALSRQGRSAEIEWRPAYAEAAKACNEAARGDDPPSALSTVASSLGGRSVPVPKECE